MATAEVNSLMTYRVEQLELKIDNVLARLERELASVNEKLGKLLADSPVDKYKMGQFEDTIEAMAEEIEHLKVAVEASIKSNGPASIAAKYAPPAITAASITAVAELIRQLITTIGR